MSRLLAMGLLLWVMAAPHATANSAAASQDDLAAYKELQLSKWESQKELQAKDVEALRQQITVVDKRVDDQLTQLGQSVDRLGVVISMLSTATTVLLVLSGFLGYRNAKSEAKEAAKDVAKEGAQEWFDKQAKELKEQIDALARKAEQVHVEMDGHAQKIQAHAADVAKAISTAQESIGKVGGQLAPDLEESTRVLAQRDRELKAFNEDHYSFDDWNTRAHAAYAAGSLEEAAYFWLKASGVANAGAVNVAQVLVNRGIAQHLLKQNEAAVNTYDEVVRRFGEEAEPALRQQVAMALVNKGAVQDEQEQGEAAIATCDEVLRRFGEASGPALGEQVAMALNNKGIAQSHLKQREAAIATFDEVLHRFGNAAQPALREQVATAMFNKGIAQGQIEQREAAIVTFDEVLRRFGEAAEPALRVQVAKTLLSKAAAQGQMAHPEAAIATLDELLRRFGEAAEPALRELVAKALVYKGAAQGRLEQHEAAIATFDEVLRRFGEAAEPALREQVAQAKNGAGFVRLLKAKAMQDVGNPATQELLRTALSDLNDAATRCAQSDGMVLGNRAYVQCLLGNADAAAMDFAAALRAPVRGGQEIYQATLKDLEIHPLAEDANMRAIVELAWGTFEARPEAD